jgi:hypothetical protein
MGLLLATNQEGKENQHMITEWVTTTQIHSN